LPKEHGKTLRQDSQIYELIVRGTDDNWDDYEVTRIGSVKEQMLVLYDLQKRLRTPEVSEIILRMKDGKIILQEEF
jgi:hypothetical protein